MDQSFKWFYLFPNIHKFYVIGIALDLIVCDVKKMTYIYRYKCDIWISDSFIISYIPTAETGHEKYSSQRKYFENVS